MGPSDPDGPHDGAMKFAIWVGVYFNNATVSLWCKFKPTTELFHKMNIFFARILTITRASYEVSFVS